MKELPKFIKEIMDEIILDKNKVGLADAVLWIEREAARLQISTYDAWHLLMILDGQKMRSKAWMNTKKRKQKC